MSAVDVLAGYTPVPNNFLDQIADMTNAELRAALAVIRATLGYNVEEKPLSISDVQKGSGLSRQGAISGLKRLKGRHWISSRAGESSKRIVRWEGSQPSRLVNGIDQSTELTSQPSRLPSREEIEGSQPSRLVNGVDPLYIIQDSIKADVGDPIDRRAREADHDRLMEQTRALLDSPQIPTATAAAGGGIDPALGELAALYQDNIGTTSPIIAQSIREAAELYSVSWVREAIKKAAKSEKRNWSYVEGILKGWRRDGLAQPPTLSAPDPVPTRAKLKPPDPNCPQCHGQGVIGNDADGWGTCSCRRGVSHVA